MTGNREDVDLYRLVLDYIPEIIWMSDPAKNHIFYISPGYEKVWGRSPESLYQFPRSWLEAIHPEDRDRILESAVSKQVSGEYSEEYRILRPDGTVRWIYDRAFPVRDRQGRVDRIVGIAEDITERKRMETTLRESQARFAGVITLTVDGVVMVDEAQKIIVFNQGAEKMFGYETSEVIGKPLDLLMPERFTEVHHQHVRNFGAGPGTSRLMGERVCKITGRRKDGTEFPAEVSISKWVRNGETIFTAIVRDISDRMKAEETIHRLAYYDPLTGLPNRSHFQDLLRQAIFQGQAFGKPIAVLLLDLDRFKEINDTLGHHRGDLLLQHVGRRLQEVLRPTDTVARLGGDEFGVLLPLASSDHASLVATKIIKGLEEPFEIEGLPIAVEPSIGIALYPDHGASAESLIQRGDVALYLAKRAGHGHRIYTPEQDRHSPRKLALLGELRRAIETGQLFLVYQPRLDLRTSRVDGVEALIRWKHPTLGMVQPGEFILPAESTGLIRPLTSFVLKEALAQCRTWHKKKQRVRISVNLSVRNLQDPQLPDQVLAVLAESGLEPSWLEMEITESSIMDNMELSMKTMMVLGEKGIHFSIDDFGIGYSSLSYLSKLPVKTVKIDRSFVKNMLDNQGNALIVRSIIDLAHNLGLQVVAEGVEDQETLERLIYLGCDAVQGYHICRPVPAEELNQVLKSRT